VTTSTEPHATSIVVTNTNTIILYCFRWLSITAYRAAAATLFSRLCCLYTQLRRLSFGKLVHKVWRQRHSGIKMQDSCIYFYIFFLCLLVGQWVCAIEGDGEVEGLKEEQERQLKEEQDRQCEASEQEKSGALVDLLPTELVEKIFDELDVQSLVTTLPLLSKRYRKLFEAYFSPAIMWTLVPLVSRYWHMHDKHEFPKRPSRARGGKRRLNVTYLGWDHIIYNDYLTWALADQHHPLLFLAGSGSPFLMRHFFNSGTCHETPVEKDILEEAVLLAVNGNNWAVIPCLLSYLVHHHNLRSVGLDARIFAHLKVFCPLLLPYFSDTTLLSLCHDYGMNYLNFSVLLPFIHNQRRLAAESAHAEYPLDLIWLADSNDFRMHDYLLLFQSLCKTNRPIALRPIWLFCLKVSAYLNKSPLVMALLQPALQPFDVWNPVFGDPLFAIHCQLTQGRDFSPSCFDHLLALYKRKLNDPKSSESHFWGASSRPAVRQCIHLKSMMERYLLLVATTRDPLQLKALCYMLQNIDNILFEPVSDSHRITSKNHLVFHRLASVLQQDFSLTAQQFSDGTYPPESLTSLPSPGGHLQMIPYHDNLAFLTQSPQDFDAILPALYHYFIKERFLATRDISFDLQLVKKLLSDLPSREFPLLLTVLQNLPLSPFIIHDLMQIAIRRNATILLSFLLPFPLDWHKSLQTFLNLAIQYNARESFQLLRQHIK
jgi:hypothetical protein